MSNRHLKVLMPKYRLLIYLLPITYPTALNESSILLITWIRKFRGINYSSLYFSSLTHCVQSISKSCWPSFQNRSWNQPFLTTSTARNLGQVVNIFCVDGCKSLLLFLTSLPLPQNSQSGLFKREAQWHHLLLESVRWPLVSVKAKAKCLTVESPQALVDLALLLSLPLNYHLPSFSCSHPCGFTGHLADL